jgi:hypothetical protein
VLHRRAARTRKRGLVASDVVEALPGCIDQS